MLELTDTLFKPPEELAEELKELEEVLGGIVEQFLGHDDSPAAKGYYVYGTMPEHIQHILKAYGCTPIYGKQIYTSDGVPEESWIYAIPNETLYVDLCKIVASTLNGLNVCDPRCAKYEPRFVKLIDWDRRAHNTQASGLETAMVLELRGNFFKEVYWPGDLYHLYGRIPSRCRSVLKRFGCYEDVGFYDNWAEPHGKHDICFNAPNPQTYSFFVTWAEERWKPKENLWRNMFMKCGSGFYMEHEFNALYKLATSLPYSLEQVHDDLSDDGVAFWMVFDVIYPENYNFKGCRVVSILP